jgi:cytochrome c oxidase subunit 2
VSSLPHRFRRLIPFAPLALVVLLAGSAWAAGFPQNTLDPTTDFGHKTHWLFMDILWWEIGIFVVVEGALVVALLRFMGRKGEDPHQMHGHTGVEVAWTLAPAMILVFIGVPTVMTIFRTQAPAPKNSLEIQVIGHQWWWEFRYPQLGIVTANEVHLPQGRPVHFILNSADIIHSFWIPRLGGKRDVIPTRTNHLWWTADSVGVMPGQCAEFCGTSHANMRLLGVVDSPSDFDAWVAAEKDTLPVPPSDSLALEGAKVFANPGKLCSTCHTMNGVSAGVVGPNLSHVGSRRFIAAGLLENTPTNIARWVQNPPAVKPGALMPVIGITPDEARALAAYLTTRK